MRKLREGDYDAIVLAMAGLKRLHASARHTVPFEVHSVIPAVAQGALAVETRANGTALAAHLRAAINDPVSELAVVCERAALHRLQGGCQAPIGIHAQFVDDRLTVHGAIASLDGTHLVRGERRAIVSSIEAARDLGMALADVLREGGGLEILAMNPRPAMLPLAGKLIVMGRTQNRASGIAAALRADGAEVIELRSGDAAPARVPDVLVFPSSGAVGAASALLAELHRAGKRPTVAAMGPQSSAAAMAAGFAPDLVAPEAATDALVGIVRNHLLESNNA